MTDTDESKISLFLLRALAIVTVAGVVGNALSPIAEMTLGRPCGAAVEVFALALVAVVAYLTCQKDGF